MKPVSILFLLSVAACGGSLNLAGDCFHAGGLDVCSQVDGAVSPTDISILVSIVEEEVQRVYPEVTNLVKTLEDHDVSVLFVTGGLAVGCVELQRDIYQCAKLAAGVNVDGDAIFVSLRAEGCLAVMSLGHELLHSVEAYYLGGFSQDHSTLWLFRAGTPTDETSIEDFIASNAFEALGCAEDE